MKQVKRVLSMLLALALVFSVVPPVSIHAESSGSAAAVTVDTQTGSGNMNLTEIGTTDWVHFTGSQINRKLSPSEDGSSTETIEFMNESPLKHTMKYFHLTAIFREFSRRPN